MQFNFCLSNLEVVDQLPFKHLFQNIPLNSSEDTTNVRFELAKSENHLSIIDRHKPDLRPLSSRDLINEWKQRLLSFRGKQEPLAKALGIAKRPLISPVIDTTAGLGRDSIVMAQLGAKVIMIERELPLAALLYEALQLASHEDWFNSNMEITLFPGDSTSISESLKLNSPIYYCDPMFNHKVNKSANNKRVIQFLQHLCHKQREENLPQNLLLTLNSGEKLIVKKALNDPPMKEHLNFQLKGKSFRFDIHLKP